MRDEIEEIIDELSSCAQSDFVVDGEVMDEEKAIDKLLTLFKQKVGEAYQETHMIIAKDKKFKRENLEKFVKESDYVQLVLNGVDLLYQQLSSGGGGLKSGSASTA